MATTRTATVTFLGASGTVTGSKYLITVAPGTHEERRFLVDAGIYQGDKRWRELNWAPFPVDPASLDGIVLTHAHTDHVGYLPALVREGFDGPVWATRGTRLLGEIVLRDAGKLQETETQLALRGGYSKHAEPQPLFTSDDVEDTLPLVEEVPFEEDVPLGGGLVARWTRAGHILGSASVLLSLDGAALAVFSGDLGRHDHPILKSRGTPPGAPVAAIESTYGDREHPEPEREHEAFADAIRRTADRGGIVVVPAFAIDRTETVLKALSDMLKEGRIPDLPVIVDSPMGLRALDVYTDRSLGELRDDVRPEDFVGTLRITQTATADQSKRINSRRDPCIIISSSGMAEGGRVLHHLERLLPDPRTTVVLTGFQAEGTRGRALEDGAREVKIHGHYVRVRAEIVRDREFSVHGDASDLLDWARALDPRPETFYVVHGESAVARVFATRLAEELDVVAVTPRYGEVVSLTGGA